jgi:hypothetical protein
MNPDSLCYVDQFLHGLNKFHGLFTTSSVELQPGVVSDDQQPPMLLTLLPILNQQGHAENIFVGMGSIERSLLIGKTDGATVTHVTGRTLLRAAKDVLRSCKKMMLIATASNSPYKDGNFPSGTNWDDYIKWCVVEMKKVTADEKAGMIAKPGLTISQVVATTARTVATTTPAAEEEEEVEILAVDTASFPDVLDCVADELLVGVEDEFAGPPENAVDDEPDGKFFKDFIAWCLWGHILIENDEDMKSMSFTESKVGSGYGRKTSSRRVLKAAAASRLEGLVSVDNRCGTKKQKRASPDEDDANTCSDDETAGSSFVFAEDDGILRKVLEIFGFRVT